MNEIDKKKYMSIINKNRNKKDGKKDKDSKEGSSAIKRVFINIFIVLVLFLSLAIVCKENASVKEKVISYLYSEDISFTKIKNIYNKYLGGILPIKKEVNMEKVFNESLKYNKKVKYEDGVLLEVDTNYLVPALKEGMIVFIGDKENYGKTIIVEDLDGVYNWYGNIDNSSLKLYDYVEKGSLIGEASLKLYLVFSKGDKFLDYEEYIK